MQRIPVTIRHVKRLLRSPACIGIKSIAIRNTCQILPRLGVLRNAQPFSWYSTVATSIQDATTFGNCPGCGATFQKTNPSKPGYLPDLKKKTNTDSNILNIHSSEDCPPIVETFELNSHSDSSESTSEKTLSLHSTICQRCYSLKHHRNPSTSESTLQFLRGSQQYGSSLEFLKTKRDPLIVAVFDVADLPASLGSLPSLIAQNPTARVLLAANKMDVLPRSARQHENRIRDWIVQYMKTLGLPTKQIVSVTLTSATKGWGISTLLRKIDEERRVTDDVYLVGCTNVGKSAIVNRFLSQITTGKALEKGDAGRLQKLKLKYQYNITSSSLPGTTLGTIKIPLHVLLGGENDNRQNWEKRRYVTKERYMIDTPGIINENQLIHQLDIKKQMQLVSQQIKSPLKPITFQLEAGKSLLLKPLVRIDLLKTTRPVLVTLFTPLTPHLTRTDKLPTIEEGNHNDITTDASVIQRPLKEDTIMKMKALAPIRQTVHVKGIHRSQASVDFSFAGVGWVALAGEFDNAVFRIWLPKEANSHQAFALRDPSFLPYEYKGSIRKFFGSGERAKK